jgi:hypothetical protein
MKKILVVLLILAMAGGVFAQQGDWSIGGSVEVGTRLDFNPQPDVDATDDPALVNSVTFWGWDHPRGLLDINYSRGIVNVGIRIHSFGDPVFDVAFNGDDFKGQFKLKNLINALNGNGGEPASWQNSDFVERLWGEYKFVNGMITVQAAANSPDTEFWTSDKTATFFGTGLAGKPAGSGDTSGAKDLRVAPGYLGDDMPYITGWKTYVHFEHGAGDKNTFTKVDHHNYLMVGADISALSFGVIVPNLFTGVTAWQNTGISGTELLAHALPYTVLGVSFNQSPLEIAAQFLMKNYAIYFGGRFFAGPITVGLSLTGVLDANGQNDPNDSDPKMIKIGGRVDYNGGSFGGGIKGFYSRDEKYYDAPGAEGYVSLVGIEPTFFINAIPSHLRFDLDLGMYFLSDVNDAADTKEKEVIWAVQPQVFWNFLGTGASDSYWGDFQTGVIFRYRLAVADLREFTRVGTKEGANFLDIVFKLSF